MHKHKCGKCSHIWEHSESNAGIAEAHMCPSCGNGPYWLKHSIRIEQEPYTHVLPHVHEPTVLVPLALLCVMCILFSLDEDNAFERY